MTPPSRFCLALCLAALAAVGGSASRASADEAVAALAKYNKPIEEAVDKALAYLAKNQHAEGYWPSGIGKNTAITSLAVMAFLAKGYTPSTGPYGETVNKGIDFVLSSQKPNGLLAANASHGPFGYSHAISTLMLSEASGMVDPKRQEAIDKVLPHAVRLILTAQKVNKHALHKGGWRYQATSSDADISCTGWALMALRSARNNGAPVPKEAIDEAVKFVVNCRQTNPPQDAKQGVGFCYQPGSNQPGLARTGTAVLCLEMCGRHRSKEALQGGDYILAHPAKQYGADFFYYGLYYCSQGMFQLGERHWEQFAPQMYEMMLKFQQKDGSWPQGSSNESTAGTCYSTAMGVLAITVSYRQLPIYQR